MYICNKLRWLISLLSTNLITISTFHYSHCSFWELNRLKNYRYTKEEISFFLHRFILTHIIKCCIYSQELSCIFGLNSTTNIHWCDKYFPQDHFFSIGIIQIDSLFYYTITSRTYENWDFLFHDLYNFLQDV